MHTIPNPPRRSLRATRTLISVLLAACCGWAQGAAIEVPNGSFSNTANQGAIGGGLLGASANDVLIGDGPWRGSYYGAIGLLAPPTLSIGNGEATIDGLLGVSVLGIINNGGYFSQTLPTAWEAGKRYVVTARVSTPAALDLGVLGNGSVGVALRSGNTTLATTRTAPAQLVSLSSVGVNEYQVSLTYDAVSPPPGNIGIQLLGTPQGVLNLGLLGTAVYTRVSLDASAINPIAGSVIAVDSSPMSATVAEAFSRPLSVKVEDASGDPVPNVAVTFAGPTTGAGAVLSASQVSTDADGFATATAVANTVAGSYSISVSVNVPGVAPAVFSMTNTAGAPASVDAFGDGVVQAAEVATPFPEPLLAKVRDAYGNPVPGVETSFITPADGASAVLDAPVVATDADGIAATGAVANTQPGQYVIAVLVPSLSSGSEFALENTLPVGTEVGSGSGNAQAGATGSAFNCALEVIIRRPDASPFDGLPVRFTAPSTGPSATFFDGTNNGMPLVVTTDADGKARVQAIANDLEGDYEVMAELVGAPDQAPVLFELRNIGSLIHRDGFDSPCAPFP